MASKSTNKGIIAVDIFCGAGGLTRGLLDAGIKVKKGYDIDPKLKDTYEKNNEGVKFYCNNVSELKKEEIMKDLDLENNYLLLAGCAPCQPFSEINKKDIEEDGRKVLLLEFGRLVKEIKPDFIIAENVPGLKKGKGKIIFESFEKILKDENYFFDSDILNAKDFGVPQNRKRLILLASKHAQVKIPKGEYGIGESDEKKCLTVRDTILKYPKIEAGEKHPLIPNHEARNLSKTNKLRLRYINRFDWPANLQLECHKNHKGHTDVYGRMKWDCVAPTLTCKCTSISNGRFGHPDQTRAISVREAAALQTFKDNYIFYGTLTDTTKWIGNAVPPLMSFNIAKQLINTL